ncbi:S-adenosyl-L-methionine-dependent methyltransferase [Dendryphion nanum]|uniref:S-adenosyl-L-methionine-dependent methyltransferase n=1 Tax=Dendryphion nanum TaxID=256645 RepID=A0A9P9E0R3_9PLEO|nr:S-adenosyl-L-methionine-dependent methyltransferase [Dendryphion nanum]
MSSEGKEIPDVGTISDWFENRPINRENRQKLAESIRSKLPVFSAEWKISTDGKTTRKSARMLDYACGPGLFSRLFAPYVSSIHAIDLSPGMIKRYKDNLPSFEIDSDKVVVEQGDLLSNPVRPPSLDSDEYREFDVITVGSALRHFSSARDAIHLLGLHLKIGGVLLIQDLHRILGADNDETSKNIKSKPQGLRKEEMEEMMAAAGLVDFRFELLPENFSVELLDEKVVVVENFVAIGRRSA